MISIRDLVPAHFHPLQHLGSRNGAAAQGGDAGSRPIHVLDLAGMAISAAVLGSVPAQLQQLPSLLTSVDLSEAGLSEQHADGLLALLRLG